MTVKGSLVALWNMQLLKQTLLTDVCLFSFIPSKSDTPAYHSRLGYVCAEAFDLRMHCLFEKTSSEPDQSAGYVGPIAYLIERHAKRIAIVIQAFVSRFMKR